ncbi:MAG: TIM-barrel domain-containing protein, partial [Ktedonobacterales bacterium]
MEHPEAERHSEYNGYQPIGAMASIFGIQVHHIPAEADQLEGAPEQPLPVEQVPSGQIWRFGAAHDQPLVEVALLTQEIARVRLVPDAGQALRAGATGHEVARSWAVLRRAWEPLHVALAPQERGKSILATDVMQIEVATEPFRLTFRWPDGVPFAEDDPALGMGVVAPLGSDDLPDPLLPAAGVRCYKRLAPNERILGAGERAEPLEKRGSHLTFWNTDPPQPHNATTGAMYVSIPFWLGMRAGRCYGIFLDSARRSDLDVGASHPDLLSFGVASGELTYYVFAGPTPAAVLAQYSAITGRMPLPPRWALGYGQSRWSYFPAEHLRAVADGLRSHRIPCDSLWLDIDYMDGYRVFTWSPTRYPQPSETLGALAAQGFKVVTIIDP